jgi:hypothetical protein
MTLRSVAPLVDVEHLYDNALLSKPLRKRLTMTLVRFQQRPQASLPEALGPAGYTGLLRVVHHDHVTVAALRDPILQHTREQARAFPSVLAIHDTTDFRFGGKHPRRGLGPLKVAGQGFFFHPCLLVSDDARHLPLGVVNAVTWARPPKSEAKVKAKPWRRVVNDTESARWSEQMRDVDEALRDAHHQVLHLMDREAGDYGLLAEARGAHRCFVIRMGKDRLVVPGVDDAPGARTVRGLFESRVQGRCERWVVLSERTTRTPKQEKIHPSRPRRWARLVFDAQTVELRRPENQPVHLPATLTVHVVRVWEPEPPAGQAPVEWVLFTSEPVDTVEQILRVIDAYRARWLVEEFFKSIKTGCAYERSQAEDYETLQKLLWLQIPIAVNLLRLREVAEQTPEALATPENTGLEADALKVLEAERRPAQGRLTVVGVLYAIARLGGHLRNNGAPGWLVLSRGMQALQLRVEGWRLAQPLQNPTNSLTPKTDRS